MISDKFWDVKYNKKIKVDNQYFRILDISQKTTYDCLWLSVLTWKSFQI